MNVLFCFNKKVLVLAILLVSCFIKDSRAAFESAQLERPRVVLTISETRILPFEAVSFLLELRNESSEIHKITGIPLTLIEYRKVGAGKINWIIYEKYSYGISTISDPPLQPTTMFFAPNSVYERGIHTIDIDETGRQVFSSPGKYAIRATDGIVSKPISITVNKPIGADAAAYKFIRRHGLYRFLNEDGLTVFSFNRNAKRQFNRLIASYPHSRYAQLSRIAVSLMLIKGFVGKPDAAEAKRILRKVEMSGDGGLSARAKYYKGVACYRLGELEAAKKLFQEVGEQNANPYLKYLSKRIVASKNLAEVEQIHRQLLN
ncbi:MAG: tetratricopeptide repeat protein [Pyrinomonadaceae bacterium]